MIRDDIAKVLTETGGGPADQAAAVAAMLDEKEWHGIGDCPTCYEPHLFDHHSCDADALAEAVRMLHSQAHNQPSDTLSAEGCHREPCITVSDALAASDGNARSLFTPGSRVA